jgi:hypothetical protein
VQEIYELKNAQPAQTLYIKKAAQRSLPRLGSSDSSNISYSSKQSISCLICTMKSNLVKIEKLGKFLPNLA